MYLLYMQRQKKDRISSEETNMHELATLLTYTCTHSYGISCRAQTLGFFKAEVLFMVYP
jgi:hypothetical protein